MHILWHSVKPTVPTGYGTQTALWTPALKAAGHDVTISCSAGLYCCVETWNGIKMFPHSSHPANYGTDSVGDHIKNLKPDIVWSWLDAFVLTADVCKKANWAAWVPVDSNPLMLRNTEPLKACRWTVGPTRFGQQMLSKAGMHEPLYVPCAFDPAVMYCRQESREVIRKNFGTILQHDIGDKFMVSIVAANSGRRKNFPAAIAAWKKFYDRHPDSILYLHTELTGKWAEGDNLPEMMALYGIEEKSVLAVSQWHYNTGQISEDFLNLMYNASDVHLNTCVGEGFGLPIMDAQACGCPTIVPDFAAAGEVGKGIKITKGEMRPQVPGAFQFFVDEDAVVDALEEAYSRRNDNRWREEMVEASEFHEIQNVMNHSMRPVLAQMEEELKK